MNCATSCRTSFTAKPALGESKGRKGRKEIRLFYRRDAEAQRTTTAYVSACLVNETYNEQCLKNASN